MTKNNLRDKARQFIIKANSTTFLGEHNLVHEPTLKVLEDEVIEIIESQLQESLERARLDMSNLGQIVLDTGGMARIDSKDWWIEKGYNRAVCLSNKKLDTEIERLGGKE